MTSLCLRSTVMLLAHQWPDAIDYSAMLGYIILLVLVPLLGYVCMVIDVRAYLRAMRGVLVRVVYDFPRLPNWARYHTPGCLAALGLMLPCTPEDVKQAYRRLAEQHHPDRGGDPREFLRLREQCERSLQFLREAGLASEEAG